MAGRWAAEVTIQDLGSLGELIAAVATVATLIYLALQIRGNTLVSKAEASRASRDASNAANLAVVQDGEVARIFLTGLSEPSKLDPEEWVRFSFLLGGLLTSSGAVHDEVSVGILSEDLPLNPEFMIKMFLGTPGGQKFWNQFRQGYSKGFREYADRILAEQHPD
jgi:hypothetical protein